MCNAKTKATALLMAAAVLLLALTGCSEFRPTATPAAETTEPAALPEPPSPAPVTPTPEPTEEPTPTPEPTPAPVDLKLMFVGDLMCLAGQQNMAKAQATGGAVYDFSPSFEYVRPILESADCAFGNLETTLSDNWPYSAKLKNSDNMPNCNGPSIYLSAVRGAGFDALSLANNHCCDAGKQGILDTLDAVDSYGFRSTGVFRSQSDKRYVIFDVKGVKIALLAYTEKFNGKQSCVKSTPYMLNPLKEEAVIRDVADAKAEGAELIIAYVHWGKEHVNDPPKAVRTMAMKLANAGVDVICGAHSHVVQPAKWLEAEDGRKVLCLYSMGNFVSSMGQPGTRDTFIAELNLRRESDGSITMLEDTYHPCCELAKFNGKWFVIMPTELADSFPAQAASLREGEKRILDIVLREHG